MNREDVSQPRTYCRQHDEDFEIEFEEIGHSVSRINWFSNVTNRNFVPLAGTRREFCFLKTSDTIGISSDNFVREYRLFRLDLSPLCNRTMKITNPTGRFYVQWSCTVDKRI